MSENSGDVKFTDLFNPKQPRSDEELIKYRLDICSTCPFLNTRTKQCRKCGCFMKLKATLTLAKCPMGHW